MHGRKPRPANALDWELRIRKKSRREILIYLGLLTMTVILLSAIILRGSDTGPNQLYGVGIGLLAVSACIFMIVLRASPRSVRFTEAGIARPTRLGGRLLGRGRGIIGYDRISSAYWWDKGEPAEGNSPGIFLTYKGEHAGLGMLWLIEEQNIASVPEAVEILRMKGVQAVYTREFPSFERLTQLSRTK